MNKILLSILALTTILKASIEPLKQDGYLVWKSEMEKICFDFSSGSIQLKNICISNGASVWVSEELALSRDKETVILENHGMEGEVALVIHDSK